MLRQMFLNSLAPCIGVFKIIPWNFIMKNILASSIKWAIKDINKLLCPAFQQLLVVYQVVIQLSANILQLEEVNAFNRAT